jgi:Fe-Mn family superoxide dismutase
MKRRKFLADTSKLTGLGLASSAGLISLSSCASAKKKSAHDMAVPKEFYRNGPELSQLPLPYAYNALEPAIDAMTMEIHYTKHAAAYTRNMTEAMSQEASGVTRLEQVFADMKRYSDKMRNNAGGHYNHERFWKWMAPGGKNMSSSFQSVINSQFGSVDELKKAMANAATGRFGSGWAWLVLTTDKKLAVGSTPNQDNPLMSTSTFSGYPLLGVDVWEHAYYLTYQNKRADYFNAWWTLINWPEVEATYQFANS